MRIQKLPAARLSHLLSTLKSSADKLKTAQFTGTEAVQFFLNANSPAYDWSGTLPASPEAPATGTQALLITAQTTTQEYGVADAIVELYVGSMSNRYTYANYLADVKAAHTPFSISVYSLAGPASSPNISTWKVFIEGNKTSTCYVKVYLVANDDVTLTVAATTTL